ncbi:hypothetical protein WMF31_31220 [Sorangium sp. So ce1036]
MEYHPGVLGALKVHFSLDQRDRWSIDPWNTDQGLWGHFQEPGSQGREPG